MGASMSNPKKRTSRQALENAKAEDKRLDSQCIKQAFEYILYEHWEKAGYCLAKRGKILNEQTLTDAQFNTLSMKANVYLLTGHINEYRSLVWLARFAAMTPEVMQEKREKIVGIEVRKLKNGLGDDFLALVDITNILPNRSELEPDSISKGLTRMLLNDQTAAYSRIMVILGARLHGMLPSETQMNAIDVLISKKAYDVAINVLGDSIKAVELCLAQEKEHTLEYLKKGNLEKYWGQLVVYDVMVQPHIDVIIEIAEAHRKLGNPAYDELKKSYLSLS